MASENEWKVSFTATVYEQGKKVNKKTSGRNRFLSGRMQETGKKVFLPVSSERKWKKMEESGRKWKKYM